MKNAIVQLGMVLIGVTSVHAVKLLQTSSLHTKIFPGEAAEEVWAVQGRDSVRMQCSDGDYYLTTANPGRWKVYVDAKRPYKSVYLEVQDIKPGTDRDLGIITLQQQNLYQ